MKIILSLVIIFSLSGCFSFGGAPTWVDGESKQFKKSQYLTATGSADDVEDAKSRALANLARIFEVQIDDSSRDETEAWQKTDRSGKDEAVLGGTSQLTVRYIESFTSKALEGAEIVEQWQDTDTGQHYALAAVSRPQLKAKFIQDIQRMDNYIAARLANARATAEPFKAAQYLYLARLSQYDRDAVQRDLQVIDLSGVGVKPRWTTEQLDVQIDKALGKMQVAGKVLQDPVGNLDQSLQSGIAAAGMKYRASAAPYRLEAKLDAKDLGQRDGWYWYRGALEVTLLDNRQGKPRVLASQRWPVKTSAVEKSQAAVRMQDEVARLLTKQMKVAFLSFKADEQKQ